jgi:hypothetical protein
MKDAPPPLVPGPELLAYMRDHLDSELTKFARAYIQLALMFTGEGHLSNLEPGAAHQLQPKVSEAAAAEFTRSLRKINEVLEAMIAEAAKPPQS